MAGSKPLSFITEKEVEDVKKRKQEEWERVRKPADPLERPEESYDARSLYERLKEQKDIIQEKWDEQFKFKNMIYKGLDDDEADFLTYVVDTKAKKHVEAVQQEQEEISAFREAVAQLHNNELADQPPPIASLKRDTPVSPVTTKTVFSSQKTLLAGAVKRKRSSSEGERRASTDTSSDTEFKIAEKKTRLLSSESSDANEVTESREPNATNPTKTSGLTQLLSYASSSDDET